MLEEKRQAMDERVRQLDETVYLIIGDKNVFNLIMTSESDYERPMILLNIIRHFQNVCSNNSLVEGIRLVDMQRGISITEKAKTTIRKDEVNIEFPQNSFFTVRETDNGKSLDLIRCLEPIQGQKTVYIILTVDQSAFTSNLMIGNEDEMVKSYLMTEEGRILIGSDGEWSDGLAEQLKNQRAETEKFERDGRKLMLYKNCSQVSNLVLGTVQDYTYLTREAGEVKRMIILVSCLVIAAASVIIYGFSLYFYRPLKRLGSKLAGMTVKNEPNIVKDEYMLIENVFHEMQTDKEYGLPSIVRDSVRKLVTEEFDEERFEHLKRLMHQKMDYTWFVLMVVECDSEEDRLSAQNAYQNMINSEALIGGFVAGMTQNRLVGIFNTDLDYENFLGMLEQQKQEMEECSGVLTTCCVSRSFQNLENMCLIYSETLRTLEKTFFKGKYTLIYETAPAADYKNEYHKKETENKLNRFVTEGKEEEAVETLHALTSELSLKATDIQYTRFCYFQICSNLINNVLELGGVLPKEYNEREIFGKIFSAGNLQELEKVSEKILLACVRNFSRKEQSYSPNVEQAIAFIVSNYNKDLSLDDVAGSVFLSSGYLSIIFKEETGYTVLEYITYIRMQKAKELILQVPALKVKDIAEQLGYNNVQSFIRYFKKYYGETPMAFRKKEE
ncbi:MAG: AraC family transcriptional regulator [Lachnospiraceae bacterium]|nr:AraC family transcriptional regulator [Lachnospiraceae bacterium]